MANVWMSLMVLGLASAWDCGNSPDREPLPQFLPGDQGRRLSRDSSVFEPIRFHYYYQNFDLGSTSLNDFFTDTVMDSVDHALTSILKVHPRLDNLVLDGVTSCGSDISIPSEHQTEGVADTDYIMYITSKYDGSQSYVAYAGACVLEGGGWNNPVAGRVVVNSAYFDGSDFNYIYSVMMHEITHALGFASGMYEYFQKEDGSLYTADEREGEIVVRGATKHILKTPTVVQEAQNLFACDSLEGLELEDHGGSGTAGSHWDMRVAYNDFMIGHVVTHPLYSRLSFALLKDSGWYEIDWTYVQDPMFGYKKGCTFHTDACVTDYVANFEEFCASDADTCDFFHLSSAYCNLQTYSSSLPSAFQYFSDNPQLGGGDAYIDYCPIAVGYSNGHCQDLNSYTPPVYYGEVVCTSCRCVVSTVLKQGYVQNYNERGRCYEVVACSDTAATLSYGSDSTGYFTIECPFTGGNVDAGADSGFTGYFVCPDSDVLCRTVPCLNSCYGYGKCVQGVCECDPGRGGDDCSVVCAEGCEQCTGPTLDECSSFCALDNCYSCTEAGACETCDENYFLGASGVCCESSLENCLDCSDAVTCSQCSDGFFESSNGKCCADSLTNCLTCSDANTCTECDSEYFEGISGVCCPESLDAQCTDCNQAGECTDCESTYFVNGSHQCQQCGLGCLECSDASTCTTCDVDQHLELADDNSCTCASGYWLTSASDCAACADTLCAICDEQGCSSCKANSSESGETGFCECDSDYYESNSECHLPCDLCVTCEPEFDCECIDYAELDTAQDPSDLCQCEATTERQGNLCVPLGDYLDNSDITSVHFNTKFTVVTVTLRIDSVLVDLLYDSDDCRNYFMTSTYQELGATPSCLWQNSKTLVVTLGFGYSFRKGDLAYLNGLKVRASSAQNNYNYSELAKEVNGDEYPTPEVQLKGPTSISLGCQDTTSVQIEASVISGLASNTGTYAWSISPTTNSNLTSEVASTETSLLTLSAELLADLTDTYTLTVSVSNVFGKSSSLTSELSVSTNAGLMISLSTSPAVTIKVSQDKSIKAILEDDCGQTGTTRFEWSFLQTESGQPTTEGDPFRPETGGNTLQILAGDLQGGFTYLYQVTVSKGSLSTSQTVSVTVESSDLVAILDKTDQEVSSGVDLVLDGSQSYDPDSSNTGLNYTWACSDRNGQTCTGADNDPLIDSEDSVVTIPKDRLVAGEVLDITLIVSADTRSAEDTATLTVKDAGETEATLYSYFFKVPYHVDLTILILVRAGASIEWEQTDGPSLAPTTDLNLPYIRFKANSMSPGVEYTYLATITNSDGQSIGLSITWKTNLGAICNGNVGLESLGNSMYTLSISDCYDQDEEDTPLLYSFGVIWYWFYIPLSFGSEANSLTMRILPGSYTLLAVVCDRLWSCHIDSDTFSVSSARRLEDTDLQSAFEEDKTDDPSLVPMLVFMYVESYDLVNSEWQYLLGEVQDYMNSLSSFDEITITSLLGSAAVLLDETQAIAEADATQVLELLQTITATAESKLTDADVSMLYETFDTVMEAFTSSATVLEQVILTAQVVNRNMMTDMPVGDEAQQWQSAQQLVATRSHRVLGASLQSGYSFTIDGSDGSFSVSIENLSDFSAQDIVDVEVTLVNNTVDISLYSSGQYDETTLSITLHEQTTPTALTGTLGLINITFPYSYSTVVGCYVLEDSLWVLEPNCNIIVEESATILQIPHTSVFKIDVLEDIATEEASCSTSFAVLYVTCGVVVTSLILSAVFWFRIDRAAAKVGRVIDSSIIEQPSSISPTGKQYIFDYSEGSPTHKPIEQQGTTQRPRCQALRNVCVHHSLFGFCSRTPLPVCKRPLFLLFSFLCNFGIVGAALLISEEVDISHDGEVPSEVYGIAILCSIVATSFYVAMDGLLYLSVLSERLRLWFHWIGLFVIYCLSVAIIVYSSVTFCSDWTGTWALLSTVSLLVDVLALQLCYSGAKTILLSGTN